MACKHPSCPFLDLLPAEIRLEFYTYLLTFSAPLKLRQVVPGSRDLAILRTNRQIHDEASEVLFELNTIVVTRNGRYCLPSQNWIPLHRLHSHHSPYARRSIVHTFLELPEISRDGTDIHQISAPTPHQPCNPPSPARAPETYTSPPST